MGVATPRRVGCFGDGGQQGGGTGRATWRNRLAAVKAHVGLIGGVGQLVLDNVALLGEPPRTHGASVGLLNGVRPFVPGDGALVVETLRTHGASVGLLTSVGPLVPGDGAHVGEAPRAHGASVGPFAVWGTAELEWC